MEIHVDLAKMLHPGSLELLVPLLPGFFFEGSVLLARPEVIRSAVSHAGLDRYSTILLALFFAFLIGNAFMLWVRLIQLVLYASYRHWFFFRPKALQKMVTEEGSRRIARASKTGAPVAPPSRYGRWLHSASMKEMDQQAEMRKVQRAWGQVTSLILKRLGIEEPGEDFTAWTGVIGTLNTENTRSSLLVMSFHAAGWSGLIARQFAPQLSTPWYTALFSFLILVGFASDNSAARHAANPVNSWYIGLGNALARLSKMQTTPDEREKTKAATAPE